MDILGKEKYKLFAAVDVGSNAVRMMIAQISEKGEVLPLEDVKKIVALGKDTFSTGKISTESLEELMIHLKGFVKLMKDYKIKNYRAVSTSAIREAENRDYIIDQIKRDTGLIVEIINSSQERFLTYKAIRDSLGDGALIRNTGGLIIDVGSGGAEIALYEKGHLRFTEYLKVGAVRIKESLASLENETVDFYETIEDFIKSRMGTLENLISVYDIPNFIGLGGELNNIVKLCNKTKSEEASKKISKESFENFYEQIKSMKLEEIQTYMKISKKQAEVIIPSMVVFLKFLKLTKASYIYCPRISLRHGILADMADDIFETSRKKDFEQDIISSVKFIGEKYRIDKKHSKQVREIALKIFDNTKKVHGLGARDRIFLEISSWLHEIGKYVSLSDHERHSNEIIKSLDIIGLSDLEREIIGMISGYHEDLFPDKHDINYQKFSFEDRVKISKLAAILKMAHSLDISSRQKLTLLEINKRGTELILTGMIKEQFTLEEWSFEKQSDFFESVMGVRPILILKG